jgi:hypothetical protein
MYFKILISFFNSRFTFFQKKFNQMNNTQNQKILDNSVHFEYIINQIEIKSIIYDFVDKIHFLSHNEKI